MVNFFIITFGFLIVLCCALLLRCKNKHLTRLIKTLAIIGVASLSVLFAPLLYVVVGAAFIIVLVAGLIYLYRD